MCGSSSSGSSSSDRSRSSSSMNHSSSSSSNIDVLEYVDTSEAEEILQYFKVKTEYEQLNYDAYIVGFYTFHVMKDLISIYSTINYDS